MANDVFMTYSPAQALHDAIKLVLEKDAQNLSPESLAALNGAIETVKTVQNDRAEAANTIARARKHRKIDDELEIDDDPVLSIADEGTWVSAWLWIAA